MKLITQYKSYVASKLDFAEALQQHLGKKKFLAPATVEQLAEAHAEAYGEKYHRTIYFQQTSSGAWCFYKDEACTREFRDDTALRQWQRDVEPFHNITKKKTTRKSVDKVISTSKRIGREFSKTEIKRLIKELTEIVK
jgi:hypothetical protein